MGQAEPIAQADRSILRQGLLFSGIVAAFCAFAFLASDVQCDAPGDGTFTLDDPGARPSDFCKLTHFPGLPDTFGSWLFVIGVFLTPVLIALGATVAAARTGDRRYLGIGVAVGAAAALAVVVLSFALSSVGFEGAV